MLDTYAESARARMTYQDPCLWELVEQTKRHLLTKSGSLEWSPV